uniref:Polysaccharide biosynthesis protein C-terminal domain-containing protein n=1 Tax=Globisporangium ultimum (strain ATCC 200006 / CBS 805.95 / DAOM BR144) TaxID=431595 RepID=K3XC79_GLOUD
MLEYSTDDPRVIDLAARFARVLSFSILPSLLHACQRQYFQALGILLPTTVVDVTSICIAIATNYVFIYGLGGAWPSLGFIGSSLSTVFASWFQPTALFLYNCGYRKYHLHAWGDWNRKALTLCRFKAFVTIAGPIAGNSFASNLANAVISGMWGMLWALFWGYGCATQVRVADYLGAGEPQRTQQVARLGFLCTLIVVSLLAVVTSRFDRNVAAIYTNDEQLMVTSQRVLPIFICAYFLESIEMLCGSVLTGMSQVKVIFWTSTIATWCVNMPVAYVGGITLGFGFPALWCGVLFMEIAKLLMYATCLARVDWCAVHAMEVTPKETQAELEKCAVNYITAVVGSQPTGYIASMSESRTPPLSTAYARQRKMARLARLQRRCISHEPLRSSQLL